MAEATNTAPTGLEQVSVADGDWAYERAKDIRLKWMQTAFMQGSDMALPAGHLSDIAEALRHAYACGHMEGYEACHKAALAQREASR